MRITILCLVLTVGFEYSSELGCPITSYAQTSQYQAAPAEYRDALKRAVDQMVELQKQRQWDKIYDLLPSDNKKGSRQDFVRDSARRANLIAFTPTNTVHSAADDKEWLVVGCGVFQRSGKTRGWESNIFATLTDSKWAISTVLISGGEHGGPTPCRAER
jgi:hypothetical protein